MYRDDFGHLWKHGCKETKDGSWYAIIPSLVPFKSSLQGDLDGKCFERIGGNMEQVAGGGVVG